MSKLRFFMMRVIYAASLLALLLSFSGVISARAQEPNFSCSNGACETNPNGNEVNSQAGAYLKSYSSTTLHGGYVAHGVGMRNLGYGTIKITDVPAGSSVSKAYLFWAVIGPKSMRVPDPNPALPVHVYNYAKGKFDGHAITGTLIGSSANPCWGGDYIWGYRADVHSYVTKGGNDSYYLAGFASGTTNGQDPFSVGSPFPMIDGASLVILFTKTGYPTTTIKIYNGMTTASYDPLHQTIPGINAVAPTGFAYSTFVVADGQNDYDYPGSTHFFFDALPAVWSGADPNGNAVNYSLGNLWDTVTVDLHKLLKPPEPDFWFSTYDSNGSAADCVTWEAQVLAYSSGNQDSDGDKLLDGWELNGYNGVNLPALGANPLHKDLFVEADYMNNGGNYLPPKAQLDDIVAVFNAAPVSNPDGTTGIHIHIDTGGADAASGPGTYPAYNLGGGGQIGFQANLGTSSADCLTYDWSAFQTVKNSSFNSPRTPIFHYMIFANELSSCLAVNHTSGLSRNGWPDSTFIMGATDFIVSLGGWGSHGTDTEREGTFVHMLGHNLGLRDGGNDHVGNKPNYLSVMNPLFQMIGTWRNGGVHYDYSHELLDSLKESSLYEVKGLTLGHHPLPSGFGTGWYCPNGARWLSTNLTAGIDWNCNLTIQTTSQKLDINYDGLYTTFGSQNNWASITFSGNGVIGSGASLASLAAQALPTTLWVNELTTEQASELPQWSPK